VTLLAIDPGEDTGLAFFRDTVLIKAWGLHVPADTCLSDLRLRGMVETCIVERPRFYPGKSKVDANDLIVLALRAGMLAQAVQAPTTRFVEPSVWKGQLPKNVCHNRIRAILTPVELAVLAPVKDHNVWDAVGIGLFGVGRFGR
jgi:hypothetical protein